MFKFSIMAAFKLVLLAISLINRSKVNFKEFSLTNHLLFLNAILLFIIIAIIDFNLWNFGKEKSSLDSLPL
jgi:hypothetical protein